MIADLFPFKAIEAARFINVKVLPAFGLNEVTMIAWVSVSLWIIRSRFVRRTRNASLMGQNPAG